MFSQCIFKVEFNRVIGLCHVKTCLPAYAESEGPQNEPAYTQFDQGLHNPPTKSMDTTECRNG